MSEKGSTVGTLGADSEHRILRWMGFALLSFAVYGCQGESGAVSARYGSEERDVGGNDQAAHVGDQRGGERGLRDRSATDRGAGDPRDAVVDVGAGGSAGDADMERRRCEEGCAAGYYCLEGVCEVDQSLDRDSDRHPDALDNCPDVANVDQRDGDDDGLGDICDPTCFGVEVQCEPYLGVDLSGRTLRGVEGQADAIEQGEVFIELEGQGLFAISNVQALYRLEEVEPGELGLSLYLPAAARGIAPDAPAAERAYQLERPDGTTRLTVNENLGDRPLVVAPRGNLYGEVRLADRSFGEHGGVQVFIDEVPGLYTLSDPSGRFLLLGVPATEAGASYTLQLSAPGYLPQSLQIAVQPFIDQPVRSLGDEADGPPRFSLEVNPDPETPLLLAGEVALPVGSLAPDARLSWHSPFGGAGSVPLEVNEASEPQEEAGEGDGGEKDDEVTREEVKAIVGGNQRITRFRFNQSLPVSTLAELYLEIPGYQMTRLRQLHQAKTVEQRMQLRFAPQPIWWFDEEAQEFVEDMNKDGIDDAAQGGPDFDRDRDGVPDEEEALSRSPFGQADLDSDGIPDRGDGQFAEEPPRLEEALPGQDGVRRGGMGPQCDTEVWGADCQSCDQLRFPALCESRYFEVCEGLRPRAERSSPYCDSADPAAGERWQRCPPATCSELPLSAVQALPASFNLRDDGALMVLADSCQLPPAGIDRLTTPVAILSDLSLNEDSCTAGASEEELASCHGRTTTRLSLTRRLTRSVGDFRPLSLLGGLQLSCDREASAGDVRAAELLVEFWDEAGESLLQRRVSLTELLDLAAGENRRMTVPPIHFDCLIHGAKSISFSMTLQLSASEEGESRHVSCLFDGGEVFATAPLRRESTPARCGDGVIDLGESCDGGGGCDAECQPIGGGRAGGPIDRGAAEVASDRGVAEEIADRNVEEEPSDRGEPSPRPDAGGGEDFSITLLVNANPRRQQSEVVIQYERGGVIPNAYRMRLLPFNEDALRSSPLELWADGIPWSHGRSPDLEEEAFVEHRLQLSELPLNQRTLLLIRAGNEDADGAFELLIAFGVTLLNQELETFDYDLSELALRLPELAPLPWQGNFQISPQGALHPLGDVNGDGVADLLLTINDDSGGGLAELFLGSVLAGGIRAPTTAFPPPPPVPSLFAVGGGALGDINGDTVDDFGIVSWGVNEENIPVNTLMEVYLGTADGGALLTPDIVFTFTGERWNSIAGVGDLFSFNIAGGPAEEDPCCDEFVIGGNQENLGHGYLISGRLDIEAAFAEPVELGPSPFGGLRLLSPGIQQLRAVSPDSPFIVSDVARQSLPLQSPDAGFLLSSELSGGAGQLITHLNRFEGVPREGDTVAPADGFGAVLSAENFACGSSNFDRLHAAQSARPGEAPVEILALGDLSNQQVEITPSLSLGAEPVGQCLENLLSPIALGRDFTGRSERLSLFAHRFNLLNEEILLYLEDEEGLFGRPEAAAAGGPPRRGENAMFPLSNDLEILDMTLIDFDRDSYPELVLLLKELRGEEPPGLFLRVYH